MAGRSCLRVRDRGTGQWEPVLPNRLLGPVPRGEQDPEFVNEVGAPRVGERLCLLVGGLRVVSTPILAIESAPEKLRPQSSGVVQVPAAQATPSAGLESVGPAWRPVSSL